MQISSKTTFDGGVILHNAMSLQCRLQRCRWMIGLYYWFWCTTRWNVKIVNSLVSSQIGLSVTAYCLWLQLYYCCSSDSRDRTFVHKTSAAENALSASTDDGVILN